MSTDYEAAVEVRDAIKELTTEVRCLTDAVLALPSVEELLTGMFITAFMAFPNSLPFPGERALLDCYKLAEQVTELTRVNTNGGV